MPRRQPPPAPPAPYLGIEAVAWRRLDKTTLHALYDQRHERGGGNKQVDFGSTVPLHELLKIDKPETNQPFTVEVHSSDKTIVEMPVELNVRGRSKRTTWRLINQNKPAYRPSEWRPGGPRLPSDMNAVPDGFLLLIRHVGGEIHARVVFRSELAAEMHDLAPLLQAALSSKRQSSGMWPTP